MYIDVPADCDAVNLTVAVRKIDPARNPIIVNNPKAIKLFATRATKCAGAMRSFKFFEFILFCRLHSKFGWHIFHSINAARERRRRDKIYSIGLKLWKEISDKLHNTLRDDVRIRTRHASAALNVWNEAVSRKLDWSNPLILNNDVSLLSMRDLSPEGNAASLIGRNTRGN